MKNLLLHFSDLVGSGMSFSDIQVEEGQPVMWLTPRGWEDTGFGVVRQEDMLQLLNHISKEWKTLMSQGRVINRTIEVHQMRLRCCLYTTHARSRVAMTLRRLPFLPEKLESLGLPIQVAQFAVPKQGLLLLAGATGVGKTTTIAALIDRINEQRAVHIVTIEDPVEIRYERKKAIITQREVGQGCDVTSFAQGVNEAMRQCPDVLVIGEIRDTETAATAIRAAESGHYVIASLHAKSGIGAVQKLLSFFGDDERQVKASSVASVFCGAIYQTMMTTTDGSRNVVAAEVVIGHGQDIVNAIMQRDKLRSLEERLASGQMQGCVPLAASMKQLGQKGAIQP